MMNVYSDTTGLKPCKCGSDNLIIINSMVAIFHVHCLKCGEFAMSGYYKREAIDQWNSRMERQNCLLEQNITEANG